SLFDELDESPLGKDDIGEVEPREFVLLRQWPLELASIGKLLDDPVVKRAMILELERADRMRDPLERVTDTVRVVVQRIYAPLVAGAVMSRVPDPIDRRIAHVDVGARHVDLEPQHVRAVGKLARTHAPKKIEVFGSGTVAPGTRAPGFGQRPAQRTHLLGRLAVDVGKAVLDKPLGETIQSVVIVGRMIAVLAPVVTQPAYGARDRILVFDILFERVGVVVPKMTHAAVFRGEAEVEADRLCVPVVKITIGLGRKARDHSATIFAGPVI